MAKKAAPKAKPKKAAVSSPPKPAKSKPLAKTVSVTKTVQKPVAKAPPKPAAKPPTPPPKPATKPAPAPALHKPARPVNESPPVDHGLALLPLFLAATHGYLSRPVDESWSDALAKYRKALEVAIDYEAKRSPESRSAMAAFVHQKLSTLLNQLQARLQQLLRDLAVPDINEAQHAALKQQSKRLTRELRHAVDLLHSAVGPQKLMKGLQPQQILTTSVLSWLARVADLERAGT